MQSKAQPAFAATGPNTSRTISRRSSTENSGCFAGMDADGDDQAVAQADRLPDHVQMAIGDGVE